MSPPVAFFYLDGVMTPKYPGIAARTFTEGHMYLMSEVEVRSGETHRHQFAWLREAWMSLPETYAAQFPTEEHLRKRALIESGFYHETVVDAGSNAAALRVAAYMRGKDEFAWVIVRGPVAVERTAKSQSHRMMDKAEFQASKTGIINFVAPLIGVSPETLAAQEASA